MLKLKTMNKEYKEIGERFKIADKLSEVVETTNTSIEGCDSCVFSEYKSLLRKYGKYYCGCDCVCQPIGRKDGNNVYFKEIK